MRPLVPVLISFSLGILASGRLEPGHSVVYALVAISFLPPVILHLKDRPFRGGAVMPLFFFLGMLSIMPAANPEHPQDHILNIVRNEATGPVYRVEGLVSSYPETRGPRGDTRFVLETGKIFLDGDWKPASGRVLLTVRGGADVKRGDGIRFIGYLREPSNFGNPGEFDYRWWLARKGVFVTGRITDKRFIMRTGGARGLLSRIDSFRDETKNFIKAAGARNSGLLTALMVGDRSLISKDLREAFSRTGTAHLLAISGLHMGIVAYLSYSLFVLILSRSERLMLALDIKKLSALISVLPVLLYGSLSGFALPAQRAVVMVLAFVFAFVTERGRDPYNTLSLAALIILAFSPGSLWDVSFMLSFSAVAAILYLHPVFKELFEKKDPLKRIETPSGPEKFFNALRKRTLTLLFITLAAATGTYPLIALFFHSVPLAGFVCNLVVVPLIGFLVVPGGIMAMALMPLSSALSTGLIKSTDLLLSLAVKVVNFFSGLPYSSVWTGTPTLLEIILFYLIVVFATEARRNRLYTYGAVLSALILVLDLGYWKVSPYFKKDLTVTFLSVGHGDSALVELPGGKRMLIDGGGFYGTDFDVGERIIAPVLWKKKIDRIDYVVLSHPQLDHRKGLAFIVENFSPREFWWHGEGRLFDLKEALSRNGVEERVIGSTKSRTINGVRIDLLRPDDLTGLDTNSRSLVIKITYGGRSVLFAGDIGEDAERRLLNMDLRADVLKAPHHGSHTSSSEAFLNRVSPRYAVISTGRHNTFGLPRKETLGRYEQRSIMVLRTDVDGAVTMRTDGASMHISTYLTGRTFSDMMH